MQMEKVKPQKLSNHVKLQMSQKLKLSGHICHHSNVQKMELAY